VDRQSCGMPGKGPPVVHDFLRIQLRSCTLCAGVCIAVLSNTTCRPVYFSACPQVTPVRVTLQERKAALAKALPHVPDPMLQAAMADELDEAFAPDMLAEARAQMAAAGTAMAQTSVVPPTGPHMLSFADRAAMYGAISSGRGSASGRGGSGPPGNGRAGGSFSEQSSGALPRPPGDLPPFPGAGAPGSGPDSLHRRSDSDRARAMRRSASAGAAAAGFARPSGDTAGYSRPSGDETGAYARESGREYGSALARDSGREAGIVRNSARDSTFTRESGYSRETMWEAGLARGSGQMSAFTRASAQEVQYTRESDGYARQSGTESSFARRSSGEMRNSAQPSSDTRPPPRPGIAGQSPRAANHSPRFVDSALDSGTRGSVSRISGRASGELRRRPSAEEPAAAAASRPGVGAAAGDLRYAAPQLQPGGAPAAPPPPADRQQLLPGGGANGASWRGGGTTSEPPSPAGRDGEQEEELGPAVRVLLPGKQSLTRSELAAATTTLRVRAWIMFASRVFWSPLRLQCTWQSAHSQEHHEGACCCVLAPNTALNLPLKFGPAVQRGRRPPAADGLRHTACRSAQISILWRRRRPGQSSALTATCNAGSFP